LTHVKKFYLNNRAIVVKIAENAETKTPAFAGSKPLCLTGSTGTKIELPGVTRGYDLIPRKDFVLADLPFGYTTKTLFLYALRLNPPAADI
jgi:hypothetical protein